MIKNKKKIYTAIGLMSGTSMDGMDLALINTDGKKIIERKLFAYQEYNAEFKKSLESLIRGASSLLEIKEIENEFTILNANMVNNFLDENKINATEVDLIAFHGHTILHAPERKITWQIGNGDLLAVKTKIDVIANFRNKDVALNGHGAPLVPIYHLHLMANQNKPVAVLNIGGVSNITYFSNNSENSMIAFDACFGNAPLDDLIKNKIGKNFDKNGEIAKSGKVDFALAGQILANDLFYIKPPKSFDRNSFVKILEPVNKLSLEDGLATMCYIHATAIKISLDAIANENKKRIKSIFVCGGGRKNDRIMLEMKKNMPNVNISAIDNIGLNGDSIEAEAFAFLGVRSLLKMPISFQKTTGISPADNFSLALPQQHFSSCGGVFYRA